MAAQFYERVGAEFLVHQARSLDQEESAVAALSNGGFVVTWRDVRAPGSSADGHGIRAQLFDAGGAKVGSEFLVSTTVSDHLQPTVTALSNGGFVITWRNFGADPSGSGISAQLFSAGGAGVGTEFRVNTTLSQQQDEPVVTALSGGGFVVAWRDASRHGLDSSDTGVRAQIFDFAGAPVGAEFLVNSATLDSQRGPALAGLSSGGFIATWTDRSGLGGDASVTGIKAQLFDASGNRTGGEFLVNTRTAFAQNGPAVASLPSGEFVIVWNDNDLRSGSIISDIKAQRFDAFGRKLGGELAVTSQGMSSHSDPAIAVLPSGGFIISWEGKSASGSDVSGFDIRAQMFTGQGEKLNGDFVVNGSTRLDQVDSSLAVLTSGAFVVSWTDVGNENDPRDYHEVRAQIFAPSIGDGVEDLFLSNDRVHEEAIGGLEVARLLPTGAAEGLAVEYTLAADPSGAFSINGDKLFMVDPTLLDFDAEPSVTLRVRAVDGSGVAVEKDVVVRIVDDPDFVGSYSAGREFLPNQVTDQDQRAPTVAALASGGFAMAWLDGSFSSQPTSGYRIKVRLFDSAGTAIGNEFTGNSSPPGSQTAPRLAGLSGGGFALTWTDSSGLGGDASSTSIKAQAFDAAGNKVGGELLVNSATLNAQQEPSIAALSDGGFVVSWTDLSFESGENAAAIKAQTFSASGARLGDELLVNTTFGQGQVESRVAALSTGGFVVAWTDWSYEGPDSSDSGVTARIFSASGDPLSAEFLVNTAVDLEQRSPAIAALTDGRFVVSWFEATLTIEDGTVVSGDGSGSSVKAQMFSGNGARIGSDILVNTTTDEGQWGSAVQALPGGGFIVAWNDESRQGIDGDSTSVKGQMFDAEGRKVGAEFLLNEHVTRSQVLGDMAMLRSGSVVATWTDSSRQGGDPSGGAIKARMLLFSEPTPDVVLTPGDDYYQGTSGNDRVYAGDGRDTVFTYGGEDEIYGEGGDDYLVGGDDADTLVGGEGNDDIKGLDGADIIRGDGGNDKLSGGAGDDQIDGGDGADIIEGDGFISFPGDGSDRLDGGAGEDTIRGSGGDDTILGGADSDHLYGGAGRDRLEGGEGNDFLTGFGEEGYGLDTDPDTIIGGNGDDRIWVGWGDSADGGAGNDTILLSFFSVATSGVVADLRQLMNGGTMEIGGGTLTGIEYVGHVSLTPYADTVVAGAIAPGLSGIELSGWGGDDDLTGTAGVDWIYGGDGNDILRSGGGTNPSVHPSGDRLAGEAGNDTIYAGADGVTASGGTGNDTFYGGVAGDSFYGDSDQDILYGGAGQDGLDGGDGNDVVVGDAGADILNGGWGDEGTDTVDYSQETGSGSVIVNLQEGAVFGAGGLVIQGRQAQDTFGDLDTLYNIENVKTGAGNDSVYGDFLGNRIDTGAGNDFLRGGGGADILIGGSGDDVYSAEADGDIIVENQDEGVDEVRTSSASFSLAAFAHVEKLTGLGTGGQTLIGNGSSNTITGSSGNDSLDGGGAADILRGGGGNDVYILDDVGDQAVELAGGGSDEVRTTLADTSIQANVEKLTYVGTGNAVLRGNAASNALQGGAGNDFFHVQHGGDDDVKGGGGNDSIFIGAALTAADLIDGGAGTDTLALQGDYATTPLTFGAGLTGIELIALMPGNDTRYGAPGNAFYSYDITVVQENAPAGVQVRIDAARLRAGEDFTFNSSAETDGWYRIAGGAGVDDLTTGSRSDSFHFTAATWGAGDRINAGAGTDQLGLQGNFTIAFGGGQLTGIEILALLSGRDMRENADYNYAITSADGNVAAGQRLGVDAARLTAGETLLFDGSAEQDGFFRMAGGEGGDTLTGGQGNDVIEGGGGADALRGNGGSDTFLYRDAAHSTVAAADTLLDLTLGDFIGLSGIDADAATAGDQAFAFIGSAAFSGQAGQLRAEQSGTTAGLWTVQGDIDGNGAADFQLLVTVADSHGLTAGDFVL